MVAPWSAPMQSKKVGFYTEWYLHLHVKNYLDFVYLKTKSFGTWTDVDEMARPAGALAEPSIMKPIPMILPASWPVHLAAGSPFLSSSNTALAAVVANGHSHLACNSYFYSVETRVHTHTHTGFKRPYLARQTFHTNKQALWTWRQAASSSAGKSIWTSLRPTLTASEADPVDLLSNAHSKSKRMGKNWGTVDFSGFLWLS